jgi:hypothetical protein
MASRIALFMGWVACTLSPVVVIGSCLDGGRSQAAQACSSLGGPRAGSEGTPTKMALSGPRLIPAVVYATWDGQTPRAVERCDASRRG